MQNDLISRSVLIEWITSRNDIVLDKYTEEAVVRVIEDQPTAYNVEKVVEELDEKARKSLEKYKESFELYQEEYWRGNMNGYGNAIEIVRNGGKE